MAEPDGGKGRLPRMFVSYSSHDREHADRLVRALLMNGIPVWFDQFDIDVGDDIHTRIVAGIIDVEFVGVIITKNSMSSAWVNEELSLARQRELEEHRVILLPLLFEQMEVPLSIRK